ncbi:hypothetical protein BHE74_00008609, partial [Ensete ventricosum]
MSFCHARDFLFCSMCGTLLSFDSLQFARCPLCGFKRAAGDIEGRETRYTVTAEVSPTSKFVVRFQDIRRDLKIEPFVILENAPVEDEAVQRAIVSI